MHFYGNMQGNRGETTRGGSMSSGIRAHVRGWNAGVRVEGRAYGVQGENVQDGFKVYMTGGSNGHGREVLIGTVFESAQGPYFVPADATLDEKVAAHDAARERAAFGRMAEMARR